MKLKIAINGFGDIGRNILRASYSNGNNKYFKIVAINDLSGSLAAVHALRYDEQLPLFEPTIGCLSDSIIIGQQKIPFFMETDVSRLPWKKLAVDLVIECDPQLSMERPYSEHQKAGARRVLIPSRALKKECHIPKIDQHDYSDTDKLQRDNHRILSGGSETFKTTQNLYWELANQTLIDAKSMQP